MPPFIPNEDGTFQYADGSPYDPTWAREKHQHDLEHSLRNTEPPLDDEDTKPITVEAGLMAQLRAWLRTRCKETDHV